MRLLMQTATGSFAAWQSTTLAELGLRESDLEAAIVADSGSLILAPLDRLFGEVRAYRQPSWIKESGRRVIPDVIVLTDHGEVVVVEAKRLGNPELRGRAVVAQIVDYAATLSSIDEADLVNRLSGGACTTWEALCARDFPHLGGDDACRRLARRFRQRVSEAEIDLVIACDEAPDALAGWVRAAGRQSALGFDLHVVEICPLTPAGGSGPIAWLPRPRVSTEIVHRTSVVVRTEGPAAVEVEVTTESADRIEEALDNPRQARRRAVARDVLTPSARAVGLTFEALWTELATFHEAILEQDWSALHDAIADPDDSGPYLRKRDGFLEGRFGANLVRRWKPSVFIGIYFEARDHRVAPLDDRGDFALVLDVSLDARRTPGFDADAYVAAPEYRALCERLRTDPGPFDVVVSTRNRWHPLFLRQPLVDVLGPVGETTALRQQRWLATADQAVAKLLEGGELARLRERLAP
ncbi:MAG: hypothetical protein AAGA48_18740 [Myxococcota bacterium]